MRRVLLVLSFCIAAGLGSAVTIDDFESYQFGPVDNVTTNWKANTTDNDAIIELDPENADNKVMSLSQAPTQQSAAYCILSSEASIPEGETKTLFLRFRTNGTTDESFGMTNVDVPPVGGSDWGYFRPQIRWTNGNLGVRDGGTWRDLRPITPNKWYCVWMVINNATDTVKVYLKEDIADATAADILSVGTQTSFAFRVATTEALDRLYWRAQSNNAALKVFVDDIAMMPGESLVVPPVAKQRAHFPTPANGATLVGVPSGVGQVDLVLSWKAGVDVTGTYPVNPAVKKHYVYISKDQTVYLNDPNLYYVGSVDQTSPTITDVQYTPSPKLNSGGKYFWMIEEGLDNGQGGVYAPGDPNNLIGYTWSTWGPEGARRYFHYWRDSQGTWHRNELPDYVGSRPKLFIRSNGDAFVIYQSRRTVNLTDTGIYFMDGDLTIQAATAANQWTDWQIIHVEPGYFLSEALGDKTRFEQGVLSVMMQESPGTIGAATKLRVLDFQIND